MDAAKAPNTTLKGMFDEINRTAFDGKLPDVVVKYNRRLKSTGGRFVRPTGKDAYIEVSPLVCRSLEAVRETLAHEMCHHAQHALDGKTGPKLGHGPDFKVWGKVVFEKTGMAVTTLHAYEIHRKYKWTCSACGHANRSHCAGKVTCKKCRGKFTIHRPSA